MTIRKVSYFLILFLALPVCSMAQVSDDEAINSVKTLPVSILDPALPKTSFSEWLAKLVADSTMIKWEVNDCGEQTGDPTIDNQRDIPMCVEIVVVLAADRKWSITINVGTYNKGLVKQPTVSYIDLESKGKYQSVKHLRDLQTSIRNFFQIK